MAALERASCGACGGREAVLLFRATDRVRRVEGESFPVGRCRGCGHVYLLERPPVGEIGAYYSDGYGAHRHVEKASERASSRRHRWIRRAPPFRMLDVGCGSGYDLLSFRDRGCEVYGIEPDPEAAREAEKQGVRVSASSVEGARFPDAHFHVVTMNYSLEHLHDPRTAMANIRRMTRPDGRISLLFPTADGAWFKIFRADWYHLDVPRHLQFFTHDSFRRLCEETGLRILHRGCQSGGRGLRRSLAYRRATAGIAARALRVPPIPWFIRAGMRFLVDGLRQGDIAEYVLRPDPPSRIRGDGATAWQASRKEETFHIPR